VTTQLFLDFLFRWFHVLFGIVWIGMLYYFNFVQMEYFKEAEAGAKSDAMKKLAPRALWWFRWGAMLTFITGLYLLHASKAFVGGFTNHAGIAVGALAGTIMFLNVWLIIWPKQQIVLGLKPGEGPVAAAKAGLASRTNVLLSGPMLFGMLSAKHVPYGEVGVAGLSIALGLVVLAELNALFGKMGPLASIVGVVHLNIALTGVIWAVLYFL
jgi:uncharacterized membrane protein